MKNIIKNIKLWQIVWFIMSIVYMLPLDFHFKVSSFQNRITVDDLYVEWRKDIENACCKMCASYEDSMPSSDERYNRPQYFDPNADSNCLRRIFMDNKKTDITGGIGSDEKLIAYIMKLGEDFSSNNSDDRFYNSSAPADFKGSMASEIIQYDFNTKYEDKIKYAKWGQMFPTLGRTSIWFLTVGSWYVVGMLIFRKRKEESSAAGKAV